MSLRHRNVSSWDIDRSHSTQKCLQLRHTRCKGLLKRMSLINCHRVLLSVSVAVVYVNKKLFMSWNCCTCCAGRRCQCAEHPRVGISSEPQQRGHLVGCRQAGVGEQWIWTSEETVAPRPSQRPHSSRVYCLPALIAHRARASAPTARVCTVCLH